MKKVAVLLAAMIVACNQQRGEEPVRVDVKDAPGRLEAKALALTNARIVTEMGGQWDHLCTSDGPTPAKGSPPCKNQHFFVFPAVDPAWSPTAAVPAWVTCAGDEATLAACEASMKRHTGEIRGGVNVRVGDQEKDMSRFSGWQRAIEDAKNRHGLSTPKGAPVVALKTN